MTEYKEEMTPPIRSIAFMLMYFAMCWVASRYTLHTIIAGVIDIVEIGTHYFLPVQYGFMLCSGVDYCVDMYRGDSKFNVLSIFLYLAAIALIVVWTLNEKNLMMAIIALIVFVIRLAYNAIRG